MDTTTSPRISADDDCGAATSSWASGHPAGPGGEAASANGLERPAHLAKSEKVAPVTLPPAMAGPYPPAFEKDVVRWMPVFVPLLGLGIALLTGLMWMVVG